MGALGLERSDGIMELAQILNRKNNQDIVINNDDIRVIRSFVEYESDSKTMKYMIYELELKDRTGEMKHLYKAVKLARIIRLPKNAKQSLSFMEMHTQVLAGIWERDINLITIIANMIKPVPLGLLFLYGIQSVSESLELAKRMADNDYAALTSLLQGTYRTMEFRILNYDEVEWLREKMYSMKHMTVVRGLPKPRYGGTDTGNKMDIFGNSSNTQAQDTTEEFIAGMSDKEYVVQILSTPVSREALQSWLTITAKELSRWYGQLQGTKSISFGLSIPMMYMGSLGASEGWSHSYTDAESVGTAESHTEGTSYTESFSESHSQSQGINTGRSQTVGESVSQSVSKSVGVNQSESVTHTKGVSESVGINHSDSVSSSTTIGHTSGTSYSVGESESVSQSHTVGTSENYGTSQTHTTGSTVTNGQTVSNSHSITAGQTNTVTDTQGYTKTDGVSQNWGESRSYIHSSGHSITGGIKFLSGTLSSQDSEGVSHNAGYGTSSSVSQSNSQSVAVGESLSESFSNSQSISKSTSHSVSDSTSVSRSVGSSESFSQGVSQGRSQSWSVTESDSISKTSGISSSDGWSKSISQSESIGITKSRGTSYSVSEGYTKGQSVSQGISQGESYSASQGYTKGYSKGVSSSDGITNSWSRSQGISTGQSGSVSSTTSATMGVGPSVNYAKTYQWLDKEVENIIALLEFQNSRLMKALNGNGAFFSDVYIATPDDEAKSAAQALAKSTWYNENALVCPLQVMDLTPEEQSHLLYHFNAFSADTTLEGIPGSLESYRYSTILLPEEFAAYTHPPRISEGGIFADVNDIPKFAVPSMRKGEIYMGKILSAERYTQKWGYVTPFDFRIASDEIMHGFFTGESRSGKTVAATRFIAELANKVKRNGKRMRIICMDPKQDWRILAKFVEPERFQFYSLGNPEFLPINLNLCKIPHNVYPQQWIDGIIEIYCRAYGLGERGKSVLSETFYQLYEEAGVFVPNWREVAPERSKYVTLPKIYERMRQIKLNLEDPQKSGKGKVGNDVRDAYSRVLDRLQVFGRPFSIEAQLFGREDGMGIDDLIGGDDVVVLESYGLETTFKNFVFGVITSGFFKYAQAHEGGFKAPDQYETILVIEEANEVLTGETQNGGDNPLKGQSEFEKILDQAAGLGLFIFSITQKIADMPSSIIANSGLVFAGKISREEDVTTVIRKIGREERYEDRDLAKWFPRSPIGWFVCRSSRNFDFKEVEPVLVKIESLGVDPPTNDDLLHIMAKKEAKLQEKQLKVNYPHL